jgi:hypothetical protein
MKETAADARRRDTHDVGAAYAIEFLFYHVKASYVPSEDAAFVYDTTCYYVSQNGDAARGTVLEPGGGAPDSTATLISPRPRC